MNLLNAIQERRSVRSFNKETVPNETIERLLELALYAPNHKMTQPWRFVVLNREDQVEFFHFIQANKARKKGEEEPERKPLAEDAPSHIIAIVMNVNENDKLHRDDFAATGSLVQNFSLLAWEEEIGVVWKTPGLIHEPEFHEFLGVNEGEEVIGLLWIGYPEVVPEIKPRETLKVQYGLPSKS
ncbi:hypothetical protein N781_09025 [Pontibacillus halophilus JSM 076056 = DSM 19796]|uniref:Putative NAD(P)H nitroreductase n=1 Tax=Pontibacillus halophilus JSM 076056 = DSM 19796 TaxID=1385510 RepID=A0A0A5GFF0_9BACI|nr:nitroreductase [Pontibacillus halophilus]KGX89850.1 hypothetical protein N781_09025 [Pontibacillus halophilus JSM 076056 = DSM 19796]